MTRALIIVDVQNDFCEGGSLPVAGGAQVAADISAALTATTPAEPGRWEHVVATKDYHVDPGAHFAGGEPGGKSAGGEPGGKSAGGEPASKSAGGEPGGKSAGGDPASNSAESPDFKVSWPVHCVAGSAGSQFHAALDVDRIEAVFEKGEHAAAYSGFEGHAGGIGLAAWLRMRDVSEVDIVGIATDHCVRATALDAVREGFATTVLLDLTAGVAENTTRAALDELRTAGVTLSGTPVTPAP